MDYNVIIRPLVGAIIGYSTNWLAIKMLFKPHEEKKIGGIKVPFTPGVIPRERDRIAKSLGSAVGERLLTEEVIANELLNEKVTDHIKSYVINELLKEDLSLEDLLRVVVKDDVPMVTRSMVNTIVGEIGMYMNRPNIKEAIRARVNDYIIGAVPYSTPISALFSDPMAEEVSGVVRNNIQGIGDYLVGVANNEAVKSRLSQAIETLVMEKVGALGAMFLDGPAMAESVIAYIEASLQEEGVQEGIIRSIDDGVASLRHRSLSDTVSLGLYQEMVHGTTEQVLKAIYSRIDEAVLSQAVAPMVDQLLQKKIHLSDREKELIESQVESLYRNFIEKNIATFLATFDVSKIVEGEIKQFSVKDIEDLIFAIVDKELNAITWIGGILGFVIGLVYVIL